MVKLRSCDQYTPAFNICCALCVARFGLLLYGQYFHEGRVTTWTQGKKGQLSYWWQLRSCLSFIEGTRDEPSGFIHPQWRRRRDLSKKPQLLSMSNPSCCFLQVYLSQDNPMGQYPIFTSWLWYLEHFVSFGQTFPLLTPNTHPGPIFGSTSPIVLRYSIIVYHQKVLEDPICDLFWACSFFFAMFSFQIVQSPTTTNLCLLCYPVLFYYFLFLASKPYNMSWNFPNRVQYPQSWTFRQLEFFFPAFFAKTDSLHTNSPFLFTGHHIPISILLNTPQHTTTIIILLILPRQSHTNSTFCCVGKKINFFLSLFFLFPPLFHLRHQFDPPIM